MEPAQLARVFFTAGCAMTTVGLAILVGSLNPRHGSSVHLELDRGRLLTKICLKAVVIGTFLAVASGIWMMAVG